MTSQEPRKGLLLNPWKLPATLAAYVDITTVSHISSRIPKHKTKCDKTLFCQLSKTTTLHNDGYAHPAHMPAGPGKSGQSALDRKRGDLFLLVLHVCVVPFRRTSDESSAARSKTWTGWLTGGYLLSETRAQHGPEGKGKSETVV